MIHIANVPTAPSLPHNGYKLSSLFIYSQQAYVAQLGEHRTGLAEIMSLNPVEASECFLGFIITVLVASQLRKLPSLVSKLWEFVYCIALSVLLSCTLGRDAVTM